MCGCRMPKQYFIAVVCDSKLHAIILWHVISMKLNIGKKITVRNNDAESQKNFQTYLQSFQTYRTELYTLLTGMF